MRLPKVFDTSSQVLLRIRVLLHVCLPVVVFLLMAIVIVDLVGVHDNNGQRFLVYTEYLVLGYFVTELSVDFVLYRDKRLYVRDRWIDIGLLIPVLVLVHVSVWLGGLVLIGRALRTVAFVETIGLELFALEELVATGSRLQRVLKLFRKGRLVVRRVARVD